LLKENLAKEQTNVLKNLSDILLSLLPVEESHPEKIAQELPAILCFRVCPLIGRVQKKRKLYRYFCSVIGESRFSLRKKNWRDFPGEIVTRKQAQCWGSNSRSEAPA
jgi:hypothetical protein